MAIYERFPNYGPNLLHHRLMDGNMFAQPHITPSGQLVMAIVGWDFEDGCESVLDQKSLSGGFPSIHHVPVRVLDCAFYVPNKREGMRFMEGGLYRRIGEWQYPFYGERIGVWVKQYENDTRGYESEHTDAANA